LRISAPSLDDRALIAFQLFVAHGDSLMFPGGGKQLQVPYYESLILAERFWCAAASPKCWMRGRAAQLKSHQTESSDVYVVTHASLLPLQSSVGVSGTKSTETRYTSPLAVS
jgi:hypothetical protein